FNVTGASGFTGTMQGDVTWMSLPLMTTYTSAGIRMAFSKTNSAVILSRYARPGFLRTRRSNAIIPANGTCRPPRQCAYIADWAATLFLESAMGSCDEYK